MLFVNSWWRRNPIFSLIGIGIAILPIIYLGVRASLAAAPFILMQPQALVACRACASAPLDGVTPYRHGRVLVVNQAGMALGQVMADKALAGIVAANSAEVRTLISVGDPVSVPAGISPAGVKLYRIYRDVCLIDWSTRQVLYRTSLPGSKPTVST
jgi:hypothetical protein